MIVRSGSRLRCAEVGQTLLGDPRGQSPLASLAEAEKPIGFFDAAVRCGLPQCETCLITHRRFRSLGGRRRVICGLAVYPGERCLMPVKRAGYRFRQEAVFSSMNRQTKKEQNSPGDCLLLRSVQISTDPGGNEGGAKSADLISGKPLRLFIKPLRI